MLAVRVGIISLVKSFRHLAGYRQAPAEVDSAASVRAGIEFGECRGMAKRMNTVVTDDLDGSSAAEAVSFSFDGLAYEIDLGPANRQRMQKALQPFIDAGRRAGRRKPSRGASTRLKAAAIRAWAKDEGLDVAERGRISADVVRKYNAAH